MSKKQSTSFKSIKHVVIQNRFARHFTIVACDNTEKIGVRYVAAESALSKKYLTNLKLIPINKGWITKDRNSKR